MFIDFTFATVSEDWKVLLSVPSFTFGPSIAPVSNVYSPYTCFLLLDSIIFKLHSPRYSVTITYKGAAAQLSPIFRVIHTFSSHSYVSRVIKDDQ